MAASLARNLLIGKLKAVAKRLGREAVGQAEFHRLSGTTRYQVRRHFDGYNGLLRAAGLPTYTRNRRIPDDELFRAMAEAFRKQKGITTQQRFGKACRYSITVYDHRWGCWSATLRAFRDWQAQHDPRFPYADQLGRLESRGGKPRVAWTTLGGRRYGDTLNFRGLLHAPVNEQGVVFLFATLAVDLGFLVESLTPGFPDCEAKRRVGKAWERVRIEFEYESRSFREHDHDPKGCDLIVCWEDNWPQCPVEVLELKAVVAERMPGPA